jgi:glycosyltransferase involved in cell wall biosynthesis
MTEAGHMQRPSCSIIIPTRNCLNYLPTTLATIELQGLADLEIIIADDGSSDGTAAWLAGRQFGALRLLRLDTGGVGPAAARNRAIAAASADLLAFLDADDQWLPGKLGPQIAFHRDNPAVGLSFTDYLHVTPDGRSHGTCFDYWRCDWVQAPDLTYRELADPESRLLSSNVVGTSAVVARRAVVEQVNGFSDSSRFAEDWDLWLRMAAVAGVGYSRAVTMSYLMRPNSETANREGRIAAMRAVVARYQERQEPAMRQAVQAAHGRIDWAAAHSHLKVFSAAPNWRTGKAVASDVVAVGRSVFRRSAAGRDATEPDCKS